MIQSPEDLAEALAAALRAAEPEREALSTAPRRIQFVSPPRAVFEVQTVEGRRFRVTVDEEVA